MAADSTLIESDKEDTQEKVESLAITMDKRLDLLVTVAGILFGVGMLIASDGIRVSMVPDKISARSLAYVVGTLIVIVGIVQLVRQLWTWSALPGHLVPEEGQEDEKEYPATVVRVLGIIAASFLWDWLLKPLGFLIVTPLYLFVSSLIMNVRSRWKLIFFPIVSSIVVWLIFGPLLGVRFPLGPLAPLLRALGFMV